MAEILLIFRRGPHDGLRSREGLDAALAALAFDHPLSVLFDSAGATLLRPAVDCADAGLSAWTMGLGALPLHGIRRCGVSEHALAVHGLRDQSLLLDAQVLDRAAAASWIAQSDVVLVF